jgi:RsiW-degrading membrane proteinase PrsW (M82 family)
MGTILIHAGLSLLPVLAFLAALQLIDSYKLLRLRRVLESLGVGCIVAVGCYALNTGMMSVLGRYADLWPRFGAPVLEEVAKALCIFFLLRTNRIGFMVDGAISGFAIGAGFAVIENLTYLPDLLAAGFLPAAVRGFGTAMMHGGTTAIFGLVSVNRAEIAGKARAPVFLPGLALAIFIHVLYNQPFWPPVWEAAALLVILPVVLSFVFWRSEKSLEEWIGTKLDKDMDLLHMIGTGTFSSSHAGEYLRSLESTFGSLVLGDLLCYLQICLELSAQAKGALLRREMGFPNEPDPELPGRLKELAYLEKQIGRAGQLALAPLLGTSRRDIWELQQLKDEPLA